MQKKIDADSWKARHLPRCRICDGPITRASDAPDETLYRCEECDEDGTFEELSDD